MVTQKYTEAVGGTQRRKWLIPPRSSHSFPSKWAVVVSPSEAKEVDTYQSYPNNIAFKQIDAFYVTQRHGKSHRLSFKYKVPQDLSL